jgi:hypothetical protein
MRGTYALMHGDVATALDHNVLLPLYLGVAVALGVGAFVRAGRSGHAATGGQQVRRPVLAAIRPAVLWWSLGAVSIVFLVVRNLPWFPYLDSAA